MHGIDGFEATRRIRAFREANSLPIVALTAFASSIEKAESKTCGMNGYLSKPIALEEMVETLSAWLPWNDDAPASEENNSAGDVAVSAIDHAVLDQLAEQIGTDNLNKVIDAFLEEVDWRWAALEGATTKADLAREAHTLASSCRSFGLPAIGDKLACIEQHARFGETAGEPPCINTTGKELSLAAAALKATVERYQSED